MNTGKLKLKDVTLLGVDGVDDPAFMYAADICRYYVDFGDVVLLRPSEHKDKDVVKLPRYWKDRFQGAEWRDAQNEFALTQMYKYVSTSHFLIFQYDGYILNPDAWDNNFLKYDYIGAPWSHHDKPNVGNGGFSLRSKRIAEWSSKHITKDFSPEDLVYGRYQRSFFESLGAKYAPNKVAAKFSIENGVWNNEFGFHNPKITDIKSWNIPKALNTLLS